MLLHYMCNDDFKVNPIDQNIWNTFLLVFFFLKFSIELSAGLGIYSIKFLAISSFAHE